MALVYEHEKILGEVIQERGGGRSRGSALNHPGIVFNAGTKSDFCQHFNVVGCPLGNPLGFQQLVLGAEHLHLGVTFPGNLPDSPFQLLPGGHIVAGRVNGHVLHISLHHAGDRIDFRNPVNLVAEELHPDGPSGPVSRVHLQGISPDPELVSGKIQVVPLVPDFRQFFQNLVHRTLLPHPQGNHHAFIVDGVAQTVQAADGGHHNHIPPLKKGGGGAVAQPVNFLIHRRVLLDIGIRMGNIGLRLVIVVVGDKVLHCIVGEKLPELGTKLSCQGFVMGQHQGGAVYLFNDGGHGKGLTGAGHAQKGLLPQPQFNSLGQFCNGLRLIAGRPV